MDARKKLEMGVESKLMRQGGDESRLTMKS
jgi:hypothetical protein